MLEHQIEIFGCTRENPILEFRNEYRFLSNFWSCTLVYDGVLYRSSEHAYMCQKTWDEELREKIKAQPTAAKAKQVGAYIPLRDDWEEVKLQVMYEVVYAKFSQNENLKQMLLATGNRYLEEGNTWNDTTWGVCNGVGTNWLGAILMLVRGQLRGEYEGS